eukprot:gene44409-59261_t
MGTPQLRWRETITSVPGPGTSLEKALADLLAPVFEGVDEKYPVQIRIDYEAGAVTDLIERLVDPKEVFVPEPDPKVMRVGLEMNAGDVPAIAKELAVTVKAALAAEPIARRDGKPVGRLVVNVFVQSRPSEDPSMPARQPLLRLERLVLELVNVTMLMARPMLSADPGRFRPFEAASDGQILIADLTDRERLDAERNGLEVFSDVQFHPVQERNFFRPPGQNWDYWDRATAPPSELALMAPMAATWQTKTMTDVMKHIRAPEAWARGARGKGVTVGIVDT